jgi:hypothetical protein
MTSAGTGNLTTAPLPLLLALPAELPVWAQWVWTVSVVIIAVALVVAAVAFASIALAVRRLIRPVNGLVGRLQEGATPVLEHARGAAENVREISGSVREEVGRLRGVVGGSVERLEGASRAAEARLRELNALLKVVQEEAEGLFIDTASTLRGVRAGASALRGEAGGAWEEEDRRPAGELPRPPRG